jgi:hypothetical protein
MSERTAAIRGEISRLLWKGGSSPTVSVKARRTSPVLSGPP